jgi:hypothetical protein
MNRDQILDITRVAFKELCLERAAAECRVERCLKQLELYLEDLRRVDEALEKEEQHLASLRQSCGSCHASGLSSLQIRLFYCDQIAVERVAYNDLLSQRVSAKFRKKCCLEQLELSRRNLEKLNKEHQNALTMFTPKS